MKGFFRSRAKDINAGKQNPWQDVYKQLQLTGAEPAKKLTGWMQFEVVEAERIDAAMSPEDRGKVWLRNSTARNLFKKLSNEEKQPYLDMATANKKAAKEKHSAISNGFPSTDPEDQQL